jgi:predicted nucleic acid-binding protein
MTFVDTNVLLYAISTQAEEKEKSQKAKRILSAPNLTLSVQVLQEFYVQATRPTRPTRPTRTDPLSHQEAPH